MNEAPAAPRLGVALVGLPASGKSSVGRELSAILDLPFRDLDELVEAGAGMGVPEIFAAEGEAGFRARESAALADAAAGLPSVLATGGGAVLAAENRALLARRFFAVWLEVEPETAAARAASAPGTRPLLADGDALARMRDLAVARERLYAAVAALQVSAEGRSPREIAREIADAFRRGGDARDLDGGAAGTEKEFP